MTIRTLNKHWPLWCFLLMLLPDASLRSQTFTVLQNFDGTNGAYVNFGRGVHSSGFENAPISGVFLSGNNLFGATTAGGASNAGTIFEVSTDGVSFANLYDFSGAAGGRSPKQVVTR